MTNANRSVCSLSDRLVPVELACDHLFGKLLFTWLSLVMSMMVSFVLSFFPRDVLDEILNLIESVSEDFPSYSYGNRRLEVYVRIYVTFEFRKSLDRGYRREFWCIYLYIAASLFTKYLSIFLDVLSAERILKQNKKYFGISANKLVLLTSPLE